MWQPVLLATAGAPLNGWEACSAEVLDRRSSCGDSSVPAHLVETRVCSGVPRHRHRAEPLPARAPSAIPYHPHPVVRRPPVPSQGGWWPSGGASQANHPRSGAFEDRSVTYRAVERPLDDEQVPGVHARLGDAGANPAWRCRVRRQESVAREGVPRFRIVVIACSSPGSMHSCRLGETPAADHHYQSRS